MESIKFEKFNLYINYINIINHSYAYYSNNASVILKSDYF